MLPDPSVLCASYAMPGTELGSPRAGRELWHRTHGVRGEASGESALSSCTCCARPGSDRAWRAASV
eukprot:2529004-Rhodomonas_salina.4